MRIERRKRVGVDAGGEPVYQWREVDRGTVWARIEPITAGERRVAMQTGHATTHRITMRFHPELESTCRLVARGRIFNVESVRNLDEADRVMELTAIQVDGDE